MNSQIIKKYDMILIIGVVLAPMTGLRIWKIGPGEILVFIWCLFNVKRIMNLKLNNYNLRFWISFISLIILGSTYSILRYPEQVIISQILTWFYLMFVSIAIYSGLSGRDLNYLILLIKNIAIYTIIWNLFLYVYSFTVSSSFFGAPLWYGGVRYSGGATNPHQIAVALGAYIFILIFFLINEKRLPNKIVFLFLILTAVHLSLETGSSTLIMAIAISFTYLLFIKLINIDKSIHSKVAISTFIISVFLVVLAIYGNELNSMLYNWIADDPNGIGRLEIYSTITDSLDKNWLFGLGPGNHAGYGNYEYHNTYLEILAMCGILGLIVYIFYTIKIFRITSMNSYFQAAIVSLYSYGFAGFAMRRLVFWVILMIIVVLAEKQRDSLKSESI